MHQTIIRVKLVLDATLTHRVPGSNQARSLREAHYHRHSRPQHSAIANKAGIRDRRFSSDESIMAAASYLDTLNLAQRQAVEHGVLLDDCTPRSPLLVIAGAGSGKTNTLAHRVAHLIVNGADPRRILMMTFSRRAASEMTRRVERIARKVMGDNAGVMTDALAWAGTFHGIGARVLRDFSDRIGLDPAFTIHDRQDSADLMNLVRHEKGLSKTKSRFPTKGTCISIYSRCVNAETAIEEVLRASFPWCASSGSHAGSWATTPEFWRCLAST